MSKKLTVTQRGDQLVAVQGGPKKAAKVDATPIVTLRKKQSKLVWWRPSRRWLPVWRVFQRTKRGIVVRRPCILDVLG